MEVFHSVRHPVFLEEDWQERYLFIQAEVKETTVLAGSTSCVKRLGDKLVMLVQKQSFLNDLTTLFSYFVAAL